MRGNEMRTICGTILAAAIFSTALADECGTAFSPCDLDFKCVWRGRSVFDAEMPFPDGVSFVPSAHYAADVSRLPAEMRINYPGIPDPNWTYGAIFVYGANFKK